MGKIVAASKSEHKLKQAQIKFIFFPKNNTVLTQIKKHVKKFG